jgi:hypothetical protein
VIVVVVEEEEEEEEEEGAQEDIVFSSARGVVDAAGGLRSRGVETVQQEFRATSEDNVCVEIRDGVQCLCLRRRACRFVCAGGRRRRRRRASGWGRSPRPKTTQSGSAKSPPQAGSAIDGPGKGSAG